MLRSEEGTDLDIGEPGHTTPDDSVARRRVANASEITAEPRKLHQTDIERSRSRMPPKRCESIQKIDLKGCERKDGFRALSRTIQHRQPEDLPTQDAERGEQIGQSLAQLRLLGSGARLQDLAEGLDLPSHRVPALFLNRKCARGDRQVSD